MDASGSRFAANELTIQTSKPVPKFLHMEKAIRFLEALSPRRLKLMGYLALLTGMRREEVVGLGLPGSAQSGGTRSRQNAAHVQLDATLTPTKGNKTRTIMLPYDLSVALWNTSNGSGRNSGFCTSGIMAKKAPSFSCQ